MHQIKLFYSPISGKGAAMVRGAVLSRRWQLMEVFGGGAEERAGPPRLGGSTGGCHPWGPWVQHLGRGKPGEKREKQE